MGCDGDFYSAIGKPRKRHWTSDATRAERKRQRQAKRKGRK